MGFDSELDSVLCAYNAYLNEIIFSLRKSDNDPSAVLVER